MQLSAIMAVNHKKDQAMKKYLLHGILAIVIIVVIFGACKPFSSNTGSTSSSKKMDASKNTDIANNGVVPVDLRTPIGRQIPNSVIGEALGKTITKTEQSTGNITNSCKYYFDDVNYVKIRLNRLNYEGQRSAQSKVKDVKTSTDPSIHADHFIITYPTGKITDIYVRVNDNLILIVSPGYDTELSDYKTINLAAKVVTYLQEKHDVNESNSGTIESDNALSESDNDANNNNNGTANDLTVNINNVSMNSDTKFIKNFFGLIENRKEDEAVMIMTDRNTLSDSTKQAWGVQFNAIKDVKVINIKPSLQEEWTDTRHSYKVTLNIIMDPDSANAPIPYYGYDNGYNTRFITLQKENGAWRIDELATSP
jgi:hypothetical protein